MRGWRGVLAGLIAFAAVACGRSKPVGVDPADAGGEGPPSTALRACLDRPDSLQRPPTAGLPCGLIPPDLAL